MLNSIFVRFALRCERVIMNGFRPKAKKKKSKEHMTRFLQLEALTSPKRKKNERFQINLVLAL